MNTQEKRLQKAISKFVCNHHSQPKTAYVGRDMFPFIDAKLMKADGKGRPYPAWDGIKIKNLDVEGMILFE